MKRLILIALAALGFGLAATTPTHATPLPPPHCVVNAFAIPYSASSTLVYASGYCQPAGATGSVFLGNFAIVESTGYARGFEAGKGSGGYTDYWLIPTDPAAGPGTVRYMIDYCPTPAFGPGCVTASGSYQVQ